MDKKFTRLSLGLLAALIAGGLAHGAPSMLGAVAAMSTPNANRLQRAVIDKTFGVQLKNATNMNIGHAASATMTVGTLSANAHTISAQFKDSDGNNIAEPEGMPCYTSNASTGIGFSTTAGTSAFAANTAGAVLSIVTGKSAWIVTNAAGLAQVKVTQTSATVPATYFVCILPTGSLAMSASFTF